MKLRRALVTGASRGIGLAVAKALIKTEPGCQVWLACRTEPAEAMALGGGRATWVQVDLASEEGAGTLCQRVRSQADYLDLIVNNAGSISENENLLTASETDFRRSFELHTLAPLFVSRSLAPLLNASDGDPTIVNVGSIYGQTADSDVAPYVVSKAPVAIVTSMLAKVLGPKIRVNCILPGHISTAMTSGAPADFVNEIIQRTPARRLGTAEEVADLILFLASDRASFLSGSSIRIDGGFWSTQP